MGDQDGDSDEEFQLEDILSFDEKDVKNHTFEVQRYVDKGRKLRAKELEALCSVNFFLSENEAPTCVLADGLCSIAGIEDLSGLRGRSNIDNTRKWKRIMLNSPRNQAEEWAEQDHAREMGISPHFLVLHS